MKNWIYQKVNELGEKAVDSMVNIVFSHNDTPMSEFKQTPLITAITRSVNSKILVKQPNVVYPPHDPNVHAPVCRVSVRVCRGTFLMCSNPSTEAETASVDAYSAPQQQKHYGRGRIQFEALGNVCASSCTFGVGFESNGRVETTPYKEIIDEKTNTVVWNHEFIGVLYDIWSDLQLTVSAELDFNKYASRNNVEPSPRHRVRYGNKRITGARFAGSITKGPNFDPEALDPGQAAATATATATGTATLERATSIPAKLSDLNNTSTSNLSTASRGSDATVYNKAKYNKPIGRVLISIPLLLQSFDANRIYGNGVFAKVVGFCGFVNNYMTTDSLLDFATHETNCKMWLQIMPFNQHRFDATKFLRPLHGQPTFGMQNPQDALGFVQVEVNIKWFGDPRYMCIYSNLNPPSNLWVVPREFEMTHFCAMCDRLLFNIQHKPRWFQLLVPNFQECGKLDYWFIGYFWLVLYCLIVHTPLKWMPFGVYILMVTISLYYRFKRFETKRYPWREALAMDLSPTPSRSHPLSLSSSSSSSSSSPTQAQAQAQEGPPPQEQPTQVAVVESTEEASVICTPAGPLQMSLQRHSKVPPCAIFANDIGDVNIEETIRIGLLIMRLLQIVLGCAVSFVEKIRYGISWVDPPSTILTLFILTSFVGTFYIFTFVVGLISWQRWRWIAFWTCAIYCLCPNAIDSLRQVLENKSTVMVEGWDFNEVCRDVKHLVLGILQFYWHCYSRIPDQREIDHRDVCAMTSHKVSVEPPKEPEAAKEGEKATTATSTGSPHSPQQAQAQAPQSAR